MVNSKVKGASFERELCKLLSLWVSNNTQEDVYWRSAISGGRSTVAFAKGKRLAAQAGDISCIHPVGQKFADLFFMEAKFYKDLQYQGLLTNTGHLYKFWLEAQKQAKQYGKHPLLIAKQNRMPVMVCLDVKGCWALDDPDITVSYHDLDLQMLPLTEFLLNVKPP